MFRVVVEDDEGFTGCGDDVEMDGEVSDEEDGSEDDAGERMRMKMESRWARSKAIETGTRTRRWALRTKTKTTIHPPLLLLVGTQVLRTVDRRVAREPKMTTQTLKFLT